VQTVGRAITAGITVPTALAASRGYETVLAFEKELNKAQALGELSDEQRARVEENARAIGRDTQFTAQQALEMQRTFLQAGMNVEQAIGASKPALDFALFGDTGLKEAADVIVSISSAYRMANKTIEDAQASTQKIGDVIAKGANISRLDVRDFSEGFKYAAPIAHLAGMRIEELAAAIATMGNNGQRGDEAGVAIRSMLVRMVAPTKKANAAMAELGLSFDKFSSFRAINVDDMVKSLEQSGVKAGEFREELEKIAATAKPGERGDLIPQFVDKLIRGSAMDTPESRGAIADAVGAYLMSTAERLDMPGLVKALLEKQTGVGQLSRIFDQRHGARAAALLSPKFFENTQTLDAESPGASRRGAAIMEKGLYGADQRFRSALENFVLSLAKSGVIDTATNTLSKLSETVNSFAETNPKLLEFGTNATLAVAALGPLVLVVGKLASAAAWLASPAAASMIATGTAAAAAGGATTAAGASRLALASRFGAQGLMAYAAYKGADTIGRGAVATHEIAAGKFWTPQDVQAITALSDELSAVEAKIARIRGSSKMPEMADMLAAPPEAKRADLKNRIAAGPAVDAMGRLDRHDLSGLKAELEGKADVSVTVRVEGEGRVTGMSATSSGAIRADVGTSMPHIKAGPV